ncbi:MAG: DNA adenine methylase, partial [Planctomycetota bacterium]
AALIYASSISTSGTSHFAQPRSVRKDSELLAVSRRRSLDIDGEFHRALDTIRREWGNRTEHFQHQVYEMEADALLAEDGPLAESEVGVVYLDPPYTADNYSRFYHLLETLVNYDYPELQQRKGTVTKGRYPVRERRYQSDFCKADKVEGAFRRIIEAVQKRGAALLVSYSADSGLLLKHWKANGVKDPVTRFHGMFREFFPKVEIRERQLMHSGQGDSNRKVRELLVLCEN